MKLRMYSIYDTVTDVFHPPFYAHNIGHAKRAIAEQISNTQSAYSKYPGDYVVYEVGEFDDSDGVIQMVTNPGGVPSEKPVRVFGLKDVIASHLRAPKQGDDASE